MTDSNTLEDNNIKGFDEPSRYVISNHKVGSYPCLLKEQEEEYPTGFESKTSCYEWICIECTNDNGNFEDAITIIDLLPELFPEIFKDKGSSSSGINKLQEFVN